MPSAATLRVLPCAVFPTVGKALSRGPAETRPPALSGSTCREYRTRLWNVLRHQHLLYH